MLRSGYDWCSGGTYSFTPESHGMCFLPSNSPLPSVYVLILCIGVLAFDHVDYKNETCSGWLGICLCSWDRLIIDLLYIFIYLLIYLPTYLLLHSIFLDVELTLYLCFLSPFFLLCRRHLAHSERRWHILPCRHRQWIICPQLHTP